MNKFAQFFAIALISATSVAGVNAQNIKPQLAGAPGTNTAAAILGSPVTCTAKGYWSSTGDVRLVLTQLNQTTGAVDLDGYDSNGLRWGRGGLKYWFFKDGILGTEGSYRVRYKLEVRDRTLNGAYTDFRAPALSRDNLIFECDGPINRVIVQ